MMHRNARKLLPLVLAATLAMAQACASTQTPKPSEASTFEPVVSAPAETASILIPNTIPSAINFDDTVARLNDALKANGQNVKFLLQAVSYDNAGNSSFLTKAKAELAAGNPSADAYALGFDDSAALFDGGLTMDVTNLVRQNAPVYFSKYGDIFNDQLTGIPVGVYGRPVWFKTALVLRQDFLEAGNGISTVDGLFHFLDEAIVKPGKQCCVLADPESLVSQWALESGYYRLSLFGVDGYLYAAKDDPQCAPVPLENIPGLDGFLASMMQYYKNGSLNGSIYSMYSRDPVGFVKNLGDYYVSSPFAWLSWIPGKFSAQLFSPEQPSLFSDPAYVEELAIPASCPQGRAMEVARFVEWCNSSQENYDVVMYGQKGVDFNIEGTRFAPLKGGQSQNIKDIRQMQGLFFTWPGASALSNNDFFRLPVSAPDNVEQLVDAGRKSDLRFEANKRLKTDRKTMEAMLKLGGGLSQIGRARDDALNGLIYAAPGAYTEDSYSQCKDALAKLRTDLLVADYKRIIGGLMDESAK